MAGKVHTDITNKTEFGLIKIDESVIATIAGNAAVGIPGVIAMSTGIVGGIAEKLGRKNFGKGVRVDVDGETAVINLYIIVEFDIKIPDLALDVQKSVKNAVENSTGLLVAEANVHIQGIAVKE